MESGVALRRPESFSGADKADTFRQFGFRLQQYYVNKGLHTDEAKVAVLGSLLQGPAAQVYQTHMVSYPVGFEGPDFVHVWENLKKTFGDPHEVQKARLAMRTLYQGRDEVRDYVRKFRNVHLRLVDLSDSELHDNFILGACAEL